MRWFACVLVALGAGLSTSAVAVRQTQFNGGLTVPAVVTAPATVTAYANLSGYTGNPNDAGLSPPGSLTFTLDGQPIAGCEAVEIMPIDAGWSGQASCVFAAPLPGTHIVRAAYPGNAQFTPAEASRTFLVTVPGSADLGTGRTVLGHPYFLAIESSPYVWAQVSESGSIVAGCEAIVPSQGNVVGCNLPAASLGLHSHEIVWYGQPVCSPTACTGVAKRGRFQLFVAKSPRADFNGDGTADILWRNGAGRVAEWWMKGATQVGARDVFAAGSGWNPKFVGNFDGSGQSRVLAVNDDGSVAIEGSLLFGGGTGWSPMLVADLDADGRDDIIWQHADGRVAIWLMDGTTVKAGATVIAQANTGWHPRLAADFNGDGRADILWQHDDGTPAIWLMDGTRMIGGGRLFGAGTGWTASLTPDLNGDGKADILWTHADGRASAWLMDGAQQVGAAGLLPAATGFRAVLVGDINGDGRDDIVWERVDGRTAYWTMNGTSQQGAGEMLAAGSGWKALRLADFGGNGARRWLVQHTDGRVAVWSGSALVTLLGAGTGYTPVQFAE